MIRSEPNRVDASAMMWFYEQHRALWTWIAQLSYNDIVHIIESQPDYSPDYAIKRAWPGWGERWGLVMGSFACEVGGSARNRCFKCPLGEDYCQRKGGGYQKFLASIRAGDLVGFKAAALEICESWPKPQMQYKSMW